MTRTGDREIRSVSGRLPDNPGELACMRHVLALHILYCCKYFVKQFTGILSNTECV